MLACRSDPKRMHRFGSWNEPKQESQNEKT